MLENKNVSLHRYDTMVDVSGSDLQLLSSRHFLAMSMTYFLASEADLTGVCISITTIGLAGCLKRLGGGTEGIAMSRVALVMYVGRKFLVIQTRQKL